MRRRLASLLILLAGALRAAEPEAIVVVTGDMHSAYERMAQFVARVDRLRAENPGVPLAVLIDGDTFELGNVVAQRSGGAVEFAMFAALAQRAPTVLNLGNHEPEFFEMAETVARVQATGVRVVNGNARDQASGQPFAPASIKLKLGAHEAVVVGLATDRLSTYRAAVRPSLDLSDPVVWAKQNLPALLKTAPWPIVMTHTGLKADREILPLVPDGTLFAGAHDHLRLVQREGRTVYFHSGSWAEFISIARLHRTADGLQWELEQVPIRLDDPADAALAALIRTTLRKHLTAAETAVVGRTPHALGPGEAALFAVEAARAAASADVAIIGGTTFGGGLPAGGVTRFALDACVRFDGPLFVGEIDGAPLRQILATANQGPDTPFARRTGENLVAVAPADIQPGRRYRIATTDWIARSARSYFGDGAPVFQEQAGLRLKAAVIAALAPATAPAK